MPRGVKLDKDAIHRELWAAASKNRKRQIQIHQRKFADHLGIGHAHLCTILGEFSEQGRIRRVSNRARNVGVYEIANPDEFVEETGVRDRSARDPRRKRSTP